MKARTSTTRIASAVLALALTGAYCLAQSESHQPDLIQMTDAVLPETTQHSADVELPPVTSSAATAGAPVTVTDIGVSVSVLNVADLRKEGVYNLGAALQRVPGVFTLPSGGQTPSFSSVPNIRGTCANCYGLTTMDGMRMQSSSAGFTQNIVSQSNLFNLGTLEVLRGSQAAVYGGGAVNGVIFMESPEGKGEPSYTLFGEVGSFNTFTGSATAQGQIDKLSYYVNTTYTRTDNDFKTRDGSSFPVKDLGRSEMWQQSLRLDYQINENNKTTVTYRHQQNDFRALLGDHDYQDFDMRNQLFTLRHYTKINEKYSSSLMAGYYSYDDQKGTLNEQLENIQIQWDNYYTWNEQNTSTAGFTWNRSDYDATQEGDTRTGLENVYGFYVNHNYRPADNWDNDLALRLDSSSLFDEQFTFRAASNYRFNDDKTRVYGSVGTGYKSPAQWQLSPLVQHFGSTAYQGNPDLKVETSVSFDIGMAHKIRENHELSITYFWTQIKDAINHGHDHGHGGHTDHDHSHGHHHVEVLANAPGHVLSQGVELNLQGEIEKNWNTSYNLSYTYTRPKMSHNDTQFENSSRHLISFDINTQPVEKLLIGAGFSAGAQRVDIEGNSIDNYFVARFYANYAINENMSLHLRVENLTDNEYIIDNDNDIIGSGIGIYGGMTFKF